MDWSFNVFVPFKEKPSSFSSFQHGGSCIDTSCCLLASKCAWLSHGERWGIRTYLRVRKELVKKCDVLIHSSFIALFVWTSTRFANKLTSTERHLCWDRTDMSIWSIATFCFFNASIFSYHILSCYVPSPIFGTAEVHSASGRQILGERVLPIPTGPYCMVQWKMTLL